MLIYGLRDRYDAMTGKKYQRWVNIEIRCDYTGEIINDENLDDSLLYCSYVLDYDSQEDPCFSAKEPVTGVNNIHELLAQPYHFRSFAGGHNIKDFAECMMMEEAFENFNKKWSIFCDAFTFDAMCRISRVRTANRLIEKKIITPNQLFKNNNPRY